ncbi:MAG: hypothetical protein KAW16_08425, partial [candidate division Zixibacteria bacterium]|nr:hypothetical protein [candidate division Zixibacteria bacterium]
MPNSTSMAGLSPSVPQKSPPSTRSTFGMNHTVHTFGAHMGTFGGILFSGSIMEALVYYQPT